MRKDLKRLEHKVKFIQKNRPPLNETRFGMSWPQGRRWGVGSTAVLTNALEVSSDLVWRVNEAFKFPSGL